MYRSMCLPASVWEEHAQLCISLPQSGLERTGTPSAPTRSPAATIGSVYLTPPSSALSSNKIWPNCRLFTTPPRRPSTVTSSTATAHTTSARRVSAVRTCLSSLNGLSSHEVHNCLTFGLRVGLGVAKLSSGHQSCSKVLQNRDTSASFSAGLHKHITSVVGGTGWLGEFSLSFNDSLGYKQWLRSLDTHPDVVSYSLRPLHMLVPNEAQRAGLKTAIEEYLKDNAERISPSPNPAYCPTRVSSGTLVVTVIRAWGLKGDLTGRTEGYAKIWYGSYYGRTRMIRSNYPRWNSRFSIGKVDTWSKLWIEVWDEDLRYDDRLGSCVRSVKKGTYRYSCPLNRGGVEIQYTLTCDQYLTGDKCNLYKPSP
ncbi:perforin-1-like isoform X2 [Xyrichtys novacula]|uniref:Perforin-1-like isoform X2 n=1 Tax=Xyrichtys novacula TaxID=13765 RepID=A0AAV1EZ84_XYRNO|nr:perforin-1-like isoform X2 [Xyrichtys novacula]